MGYTFIFGEEAQPTLKSLAVSGSDFTFVGASAILPADQTPTNKPNSEFSATGFVSTDGSATTALVTTQVIHRKITHRPTGGGTSPHSGSSAAAGHACQAACLREVAYLRVALWMHGLMRAS